MNPIQEMDRAINALGLELPTPVWEDVKRRWSSVKESLDPQDSPMPVKTPTWKDTLYSGHRDHSGGITRFFETARDLGYPFFEWNGKVYEFRGRKFSDIIEVGESDKLLDERNRDGTS